MGWESVGKGEGGGASLPILKVEKPTRIRFIGPASVPEIAGNKTYSEGPLQAWTHWTPDEVAEVIGGPRSIACINVRNGCIFHEEPLKWRSGKSNYANVIVYNGYDAKKKTYDSKEIKVFQGGVMVYQQIRDQASTIGISPDEVDWMISKSGKGMSTAWTAVMIRECLDAEIDLVEFEEQAPEFADDEISVLIDIKKFDAFKTDMTAADQTAWYDKLMSPAEEPAEGEASDKEPPAAPAGTPGAKVTPTSKIGLAPAAPGAKRPGRPSNAELERRRQEQAAGGAPATPPKPGTPAAPPAKQIPNPEHASFIESCEVLDPWETKLSESEQIDFIITTGVDDEYQITQEILDAAMIVKAGEPPKMIAAPAGPAIPPKPGVPATPGKPAAPKPAPAAKAPAQDVPALQERLLQLRKGSTVLKEFKNMKLFLNNLAGGVKTIQAIEDPELLLELIALLESGDDALLEQLGT